MDATSSIMYGEHWTGRPTLAGDLANFRNNGLSDGFDNTRRLHKEAPATEFGNDTLYGVLYAYLSMMGEEFFEEHYRCGVGNPEGPEILGKTITISDLHAVYNGWQLRRHIESANVIVEIGPGYGALAAVLRGLYPDAELILVDLPEHRPVVEYYLENTVGMDGITITTELPPTADVAIALRCMMEMPTQQVEHYIDWLQENDIDWFYLINRYLKKNVTKHYPFDDYWLPVITRNDYLTGMLHEFLLKRVSEPTEILRGQMDTLPPFIHKSEWAIWMKGTMHMVKVHGN